MTSLPIMDMTQQELSKALGSGLVSCSNVAEAAIERITAINPQINAIIRFDAENVRAQACALDARREAGDNSPWLGIPVTVKDNIWIANRPVSNGSLLFKDFIAPVDSIAVARLRKAGALILGSANCSEFACKGVTTNSLHGETRNPWDLALTPGGSSGGAAAATSAGLNCLALGTDAGGSVRRPASHTGLIGMKPSSGMIPHAGGFDEPVYGHSVIGTLTRSVADAWAALVLLGHHDPADPQSPPTRAELRSLSQPLQRSKIAWSPRLGLGFAVNPDVAALCEAAVQALRNNGHDVVEIDPPWPEGASEEALMPLQLAGLAAIYGERYRAGEWQVDPDIARQIEAGLTLSGRDVAEALELRKALYAALAKLFQTYDFLVCPTTPAAAWPLNQLGPKQIEGRDASPRAHAVFTPIFNHCNIPACSVPCGLNEIGLPVGLQIAGPMFNDDRILALAALVEAHTEHDFTRVKQLEPKL